MLREDKIRIISLIVFLGFILSVFFHYIMTAYCGRGYPYTTFLFIPIDKFNDFFNTCRILKGFNPYLTKTGPNSYYFPFANLLFYLFSLFPRLTFACFLTIFISLFFYLNFLFLSLKNKFESYISILILTFLTYPFLFIIDRGNIEGLLFILLALYIYFYKKHRFLSTLFLSFAIALKGYPLLFSLILLSDKRYKDFLFLILFTFTISMLGLCFHKGGVIANLNFLLSGLNIANNVCVCQTSLVQRGLSIFSFIKLMLIKWHYLKNVDMFIFLRYYQWSSLFLTIVVSIYLLFHKKELWEKVFLVTALMLLLPYISVDYKLIHIFLPLYLFVSSPHADRKDLFFTLMFALLLIPKDYYFFNKVFSDAGACDISISMPINILILIIMFIVIVSRREITPQLPLKGSLYHGKK